MPTQVKTEKINELTEKLGRATVAILVQTQGLKVKDMTELRNKMRAAHLEFQVAKNTLLRIATERNNMTELDKSTFFFFQAEDGIRDYKVTGVQTCALPI